MKNWFFEKINKMNKIIARLKSSCHNLFHKNTKNYCRLLWKPYAKKLKIQEEMHKFWTQNLSNMNHETETLNRPTMNMEIDLVTESLPSQKTRGIWQLHCWVHQDSTEELTPILFKNFKGGNHFIGLHYFNPKPDKDTTTTKRKL